MKLNEAIPPHPKSGAVKIFENPILKMPVFFLLVFPYWKKSCCRKNLKFLQNHLPSHLSGLPIVFDDGEWINFRLFFGLLLLFMLREYNIVQDM